MLHDNVIDPKNSSQATPTHCPEKHHCHYMLMRQRHRRELLYVPRTWRQHKGSQGREQFEFAVGPLESLWYLITALICTLKENKEILPTIWIQISSPNKESHLQPSSIMVEFLPLNPGNVQIWKITIVTWVFHSQVGFPSMGCYCCFSQNNMKTLMLMYAIRGTRWWFQCAWNTLADLENFTK